MSPPFSQLFRKNGREFPAKPAGNDDLESGHGSSVPQTSTTSGYQSTPSRVYLPETHSIHATIIPQTPTPSREYFSLEPRHGSAAQSPLTPSGSSRVIGYLPRAIYNGSSPFVDSDRLIMPSEPSQNASNRNLMSNSGPQPRSTPISSTASHEPRLPQSPFDPHKHGQALRRLETHGSLKTIPSGQQEGEALSRTSLSWSEIGRGLFIEDHAAGSENRISLDPHEKADQQPGANLSWPSIRYLPNAVYQPVMPSQGDSSEVVSLPDVPNIEDGQSLREALPSFVCPLPNVGADRSNPVTQQFLRRSQVPPTSSPALSSRSLPGEHFAANASPDLQSENPSPERMPESVKIGSILPDSVTQGSERLEGIAAYEAEGEEDHSGSIVNPTPERPEMSYTFVQSPTLEAMDEYLWSPAPSDDGQEAPSALLTPAPRNVPSNALHAAPISEPTPNSHGGFSRPNISEQFRSHVGSPGNPRVTDDPLPHIDVLIPAGNIDLDSHSDFLDSSQHASTTGSRKSSSVLFRYSGVITDGASSRPMSEVELHQEVRNTLGGRLKTGLRMLSSRDSSSQADCCSNSEQICEEHVSSAQPEPLPLGRVQNPFADAGPGSSQTSSSPSTDRHGGGPSGHKVHLADQSFRKRCPTPPLLFGKNSICGPGISDATSRLTLGKATRRFNSNSKAIGLGEQDWETVSKTGSSLADNSDSGNLSSSKETAYPFRGRPVMQHPAHPRRNHSFILLKNGQTGDLVQVPQYVFASGAQLPDINASAPSRARADSIYRHPSPLVQHNHPFSSSPPIISFTELSATNTDTNNVLTHQNNFSSELVSPELSQDAREEWTQNPLYKTTQDTSRVRDPMVDQDQHIMESKEQSSAWLSTVSKVTSSEPSLLVNGGTLPNIITWDSDGHVNNTPEGRRNREVGSSLADASSPGANFSSSSAPCASSPVEFSDTTPSLGQGHHKPVIRHGLDFGSQRPLGNFHKSLARSLNLEDSATSTTSSRDPPRSRSASGLEMEQGKQSPRRRRSSSESQSIIMDLPSAQKTSAENRSFSSGHVQQSSSSGLLLLRNPFSHADDDDFGNNLNLRNAIELRGRQQKADDNSVGDRITPSSTQSRPIVRDGVVHTDTPPPVFHHPVYGRDRPWDRVSHAHPRAHPDPLGHPRFQRPVARAESPHLHRIPHPPTPEILERHELLSRIYLIPCMVVPPIALLYGHGYMDGIMRVHSYGEISGFRNTEKTIALCWGYGVSAMAIIAIVTAMIIISASR